MTQKDLVDFLAAHKAAIGRRVAELDHAAATLPPSARHSWVCITQDATAGLEPHAGGVRLGKVVPGQLARMTGSAADKAATVWNWHLPSGDDRCAVIAVTEAVAYERASDSLKLCLHGLELAQELVGIAEAV